MGLFIVGSVLGPMLYIIIFYDLEQSIKSLLVKSAVDTKTGGVLNSNTRWLALPSNWGLSIKWAHLNMHFSVAKCKIFCLGNAPRMGDLFWKAVTLKGTSGS